MNGLILIMVLTITPEGDLRPRARMTAVFLSVDQCNTLGRKLALRSFSMCIPQERYDGPIGKLEVEKLDS